jgi:hypothetical protein
VMLLETFVACAAMAANRPRIAETGSARLIGHP